MSEWKEIKRCKECGKVYDDEISEICVKCGTRLGTASAFMSLFGHRIVLQSNKCESVVAKRTLFGWKVREREKNVAAESATEDGATLSANECCAQSKTDGTINREITIKRLEGLHESGNRN